ncbi:hypothetical protein ABK040_010162 [Willaertia magna]
MTDSPNYFNQNDFLFNSIYKQLVEPIYNFHKKNNSVKTNEKNNNNNKIDNNNNITNEKNNATIIKEQNNYPKIIELNKKEHASKELALQQLELIKQFQKEDEQLNNDNHSNTTTTNNNTEEITDEEEDSSLNRNNFFKTVIFLHKIYGIHILPFFILLFISYLFYFTDSVLSQYLFEHLEQFDLKDNLLFINNLFNFTIIGLFYCIIFFISKSLQEIFYYNYSIKIESFCNSLLSYYGNISLTKILNLHTVVKQTNYNYGKVDKILNTDLTKLTNSCQYICEFWNYFLYCFYSFIYLFYLIGFWPSFLSLLTLLPTFPLYFWVLKKEDNFQERSSTFREEKSNLLNQLIFNIKLIKVYVLENYFIDKINSVQKRANSNTFKIEFFSSLSNIIYYLQSFLVSSVCFIVYCVIQENTLTLSLSFTILTLVENAMGPLYMVINNLKEISKIRQSMLRTGKLLSEKEYQPIIESSINQVNDKSNIIEISDLSCSWKFNNKNSGEENVKPIIEDINLNVKKGEFIAIIGKVGQGKSTLLKSILGETNILKGSIKLNNNINSNTNLKFAFVSQVPWIRNCTVKENILFGLSYNEELYKKALYCSNFEEDTESMKQKSETLIGERGINLSGGQKTRLALARAIYSNANVFILDDIFSAVDIYTAKKILERTFIGENAVLKGKTILLVTHQLFFLDKVDQVIVMNDGKVIENGTFNELMERKDLNSDCDSNKIFNELIEISNNIQSEHNHELYKDKKEINNKDEESEEMNEINTEEIEEEKEDDDDEVTQKNPSISLIFTFLLSTGKFTSIFYLLIITGTIILERYFSYIADYTIGEWSTDSEFKNHTIWYYIISYNMEGILKVIVMAIYNILSRYFFISLAFYYRTKLLNGVTHAIAKLFEDIPSGKIIQRVDSDTESIESLYWSVTDLLSIFIESIMVLGMIFYAFPYAIVLAFTFVPLIAYIRPFFSITQHHLFDVQTRDFAPVYTLISEIVEGVETIRAFGKEKKLLMINELDKLYDHNHNLNISICLAQCWFFIRIEVIRKFFSTCSLVGIFLYNIYLVSQLTTDLNNNNNEMHINNSSGDENDESITIANTTVVVLSSLTISLFYRRVQDFMYCSGRIMSVIYTALKDFRCAERVLNFDNSLILEKYNNNDSYNSDKNDNTFVKEGHVLFENVSLRYRPENDLVLKNISFNVLPGTKCAIIGRTGSGKSSLMNCLLRFNEIETTNDKYLKSGIFIDEVNINLIDLKLLRKSISYIPQQPVLFSGTLRENMDFENKYLDREIIETLKSVGFYEILIKKHLKEENQDDSDDSNENDEEENNSKDTAVVTSPSEVTDDTLLKYKVNENGSNFSSGEKQLICLARAMLKQCKILLMDEATSSVDVVTDQLIQQSLRGKVFSNTTIITIAHRLETIKDYDKVIVLENGKIKCVGSPESILKQDDIVL